MTPTDHNDVILKNNDEVLPIMILIRKSMGFRYYFDRVYDFYGENKCEYIKIVLFVAFVNLKSIRYNRIWAANFGLKVNVKKSQAIVVGSPHFISKLPDLVVVPDLVFD